MSGIGTVLWKQCDEVVLGLRVAPGAIQERVGSRFPLALDGGQARVAIMPQICGQYWLDGEDLGPTHLVHVLAAIEGPADVRPVVGAQRTLPTMRWFALFTGSTDQGDRARRSAADVGAGALREVSLDRPECGRVTIGSGCAYSWRLPVAKGPVQVIGVNHDVYSHGADGEVSLKRIQAIGRLIGEPVAGVLEAPDGVEPNGLVPGGDHPVLAMLLMPCGRGWTSRLPE